MKAKRIATHRIGDSATPTSRKTKYGEGTNLVWFGLFSAIVMVAASIIALHTTQSRIVQVTVIATLTPTQTTLPTSTATPTALPVTLTPLPTIAIERGVMLAQVWLYDAPGGNKLTAGLLKGQHITVLEHREDFVKVLWDGGDTAIVGWVAERWISIE